MYSFRYARFVGATARAGGKGGKAWGAGARASVNAASAGGGGGKGGGKGGKGGKGGAGGKGARGGFEYSDKAVQLMDAYRRQFPWVIEALDRFGNERMFDMRQFKQCGAQDDDYAALKTWLQQVQTANLPLVPVSSQSLSSQAISGIEMAAAHVRTKAAAKGKTTRITDIPAEYVDEHLYHLQCTNGSEICTLRNEKSHPET
jgi:hypothetical protein